MKERSGMPYDVVAFETDERARLLTNEEEGAYHRLMRHAWINGSIPDDLRAIAAIIRENHHKAVRLWVALEPMWPLDPSQSGRRISPKQESEREYKQRKSDTNRDAANMRWESKRNAKQVRVRTLNAMRTHSERNASPPLPVPDPDLDPSSPHTSPNRNSVSGYSEDFEKFWVAYPKKTGKGAAWKAWKKNSHPTAERIVEILLAASDSVDWKRDAGRFIPNPATWLNQKRWDDEYKAKNKMPDKPEYQG